MSWQREQKFKKSKRYKTSRGSRSYDRTTDCQYYPKKRVMCPDCGRLKLFFASKEEALRYLQYNAHHVTDNNGNRPIRAYYCSGCCGWHVTHKPALIGVEFKQTPTDRLLHNYRQSLMPNMNTWSNIEYVGLYLTNESITKLKDLFMLTCDENRIPHPFPISQESLEITHCYLYHRGQFNSSNSDRCVKFMKSIDNILQMTDKTTVKVTEIGYNDKMMVYKVIIPPHLSILNDRTYIIIARNPELLLNDIEIPGDQYFNWVPIPETSIKVVMQKIDNTENARNNSQILAV